MNKKELIIELMKIDRFLSDKYKKLEEIFNMEEGGLIVNDDNNLSEISDIIFDYVGIPEENWPAWLQHGNIDEVNLGNYYYSRYEVFGLYYEGVFEEKISLSKLAECLIRIGENS